MKNTFIPFSSDPLNLETVERKGKITKLNILRTKRAFWIK